MLQRRVEQLSHVIVLCDDLDRMKTFYRGLLAFPVESESATALTFRAGSVILALRQRTRSYDGRGARGPAPGVQLAFLVSMAEVNTCHRQLVEHGVTIFDPPYDQAWGHRTVYFADPEGNLLEIYAELGP